MEDTIWASIKTDWHFDARCKEASSYLFFPAEETDSRLTRVQTIFCNHCPVRAKCLNSALINGDLGFWGGTSTDMRAAMKRTRHRAKCPVCKGVSLSLIDVNGNDESSSYQVCLACGASWRSDSGRYLDQAEQPVKAEPV